MKREALLRFARAYADGDLDALSRRSPRSSSAARPTSRLDVDPVDGGALARRELPLRAGAAGLGEDVAGSADGDRADAGGQARRRHLAQPQGDPQPAPRDPARGGRAGLHVPRRQARADGGRGGRLAVREPLRSRRRRTPTSAPTRRSSSSPAPRWALTRETVDLHAAERPLDVLFVDEAGQLALADVLAVGTVRALARPPRRPEPAAAGLAGLAPGGLGALSVLQHLLGEDVTVPPDRGLFLAETWRLRPELCAFTSDAYYEGRLGLRGRDGAPLARAAGTGPSGSPVAHEGRGQSSVEEADAIAAAGRRARRDAVHGRRRRDPAAEPRRRPRRRPVQRAGADAARPAARGVAGRHGRQVPGPAGAGRASSRWRARRPRRRRAAIGFAFDRTASTSRRRGPSAAPCSSARRRCSTRTARRSTQMRLVSAVCRFVELAR